MTPFSFLAAMMLAYQPVRSLTSLNIVINEGLSASLRILPIIDTENLIKNSATAKTDHNYIAQVPAVFKHVLQDTLLLLIGSS